MVTVNTKSVLTFDIGIKNLAYCVADISGTIHQWSVVNLQDLEDSAPAACHVCKKVAKARAPTGFVCGRHIPKDSPQIFDTATGKPIKKDPTMAQIQTFLTARGLDAKGKRDVIMERVKTVATFPLPKKQKAASFADNTSRLHDAVRGWILRDWEKIKSVDAVYLEHQPVLKNPVMKTVQIVLFTSLRDQFLNAGLTPSFHFVHAGKKIKGAEKGDAGYKDRKQQSEVRVRTFLQKSPIGSPHSEYLRWWSSLTKKDDLADALCMVLDVAGA